MHRADLLSGRANETAQVSEDDFFAKARAAKNTSSSNHECEMPSRLAFGHWVIREREELGEIGGRAWGLAHT